MSGVARGAVLAAVAVAVLSLMGCDEERECIWDPQVTTESDGSCVITTDAGEQYCWGGITVTCVPNDGTDGGDATFDCQAEGESDCGVPIELDQTTSPSCSWFLDEANYETYTAVWAECWEWETYWWYW
jgi:uncharacterized lipoprotein NlpE involved in copper resistance